MNIQRTTKQFKQLLMAAAEISAEINESDPDAARLDVAQQFEEWYTALLSATPCWDVHGESHIILPGDKIRLVLGEEDLVYFKSGEVVTVKYIDSEGDIFFHDSLNPGRGETWVYANENDAPGATQRCWEPCDEDGWGEDEDF